MKIPLLPIGVVGTTVAAVCCVTPALPLFLGAIGAGALTGFLYRDAVLLPILAVFLLILAVGLWQRRTRS